MRIPLGELAKVFVALLLLLTTVTWAAGPGSAKNIPTRPKEVPGYLARVATDDPASVLAALERVEGFYLTREMTDELPPIVMVLHGPEVVIFFRENYPRYKPIVDLAARLSAFGAVDIRVCESRIRSMGLIRQNLYPFVATVPFGPDEISRLKEEEKYLYF